MSHGLFRCLLFSFQILGGFPDIFLLLIHNLISLWPEKSSEWYKSFQNYWNLSCGQGIFHLGKCSMCTWKSCVFCHSGGIYKCLLYHIWFVVCFCFFPYSYWFSVSQLLRNMETSRYIYRSIYFSFQVCPFLLHVFWSSVFRWINI